MEGDVNRFDMDEDKILVYFEEDFYKFREF